MSRTFSHPGVVTPEMKRQFRAVDRLHAVTDGMRPDVQDTLIGLVMTHRGLTDPECWLAYSRAKASLSGLCGWDASRANYDQGLFERAMLVYVDECGL